MNKIAALSSLILTGAVMINSLHAQSGPKKQENLVPNGGFESDVNADGNADYWFVHPATQKAVEGGEVTWIQTGAGEGSSFLRVKKTGGTNSYVVSNGLVDTTIASLKSANDKMLLLQAKVRGIDLEAAPSVALQVFARKPGETAVHFANHVTAKPATIPGRSWVVIEIRFRLSDLILPGEELARAEIVLRVPSNTGDADFDDVTLSVLP